MADLPHDRALWTGIGRGFLKEARAVIEASRTSPKVVDLVPRVQDTQVFLRMAAIELRRIAEQAPDIAVELRHMAQQLQTEAEDLSRRTTK